MGRTGAARGRPEIAGGRGEVTRNDRNDRNDRNER